jgi:LemA protein
MPETGTSRTRGIGTGPAPNISGPPCPDVTPDRPPSVRGSAAASYIVPRMTWTLAAGALVVLWTAVTFNRLTQLRQLGRNAWSDIDVQLKRRHDLIPAVVAVVKGHAGYERATLEALVAARGRALASTGPAARSREEQPVADGLRRIFAVAEAYPDLRAAASFAALQRTLIDVEDHLQNARRYYNAVVRDYNTALAQFPTILVARLLGFAPREFFGLDDQSEGAVPQVETGA